ncbi:MAG: 2-C-methyl-D-erythritol 4-phosphate cytidylyltransferase [Candidatus Midichloriaceae bacterium]|jgi:2-C-methyl-D-erythritol 4-phosphate cytidylyltransferase/2-C-methyl-D-erythritol 2,4-cyclodiphosphate synthase
MKNIALIVAAGISDRFAMDMPKQYVEVDGKSILRWAIEAFLNCNLIDGIKVVINEQHIEYYRKSVGDLNILNPCYGAATRNQSVLSGLKDLEIINPENVLIHDAARPLISVDLIKNVIEHLNAVEAVDVGLKLTDTIKSFNQKNDETTLLDRDKLYATQTPQGFKFKAILDLHKKNTKPFADDISLCLENNVKIHKISGEKSNLKITTIQDLDFFKYMINKNKVYRTGFGTDIHRFSDKLETETTIKICGVEIKHDRKIIAHSDGDVGFHSITEAILGAAALGNIGQLFPNTDPKYRNIDSRYFLEKVNDLLLKNEITIINIDITIICEYPKIMKYSEKMCKTISDIFRLDKNQINVKATTCEKLGFLGREEGIAAQTVATIFM